MASLALMDLHMNAILLAIPDVVVFDPRVYRDERGFFFESLNQRNILEEVAFDGEIVRREAIIQR